MTTHSTYDDRPGFLPVTTFLDRLADLLTKDRGRLVNLLLLTIVPPACVGLVLAIVATVGWLLRRG